MTHANGDASTCPSEFGLERLRLGELPPPVAGMTLTHVEGCPECSRRMVALSASPPPFDLDAVWNAARADGAPVAPRAPWFNRLRERWMLALTATAAVATVAVIALAVRPSVPTDVLKGSPWTLTVIVKRRGQQKVHRAVSGVRLSAGDQLRFEVTTKSASGYVAVIGSDSRGAVTPLAPPAGEGVPVRGGRPVVLDGAVELDDAPGAERLDLVGCSRPVAVAELARAVREAVAQAEGDLARVKGVAEGCYQETFWIEKVTR